MGAGEVAADILMDTGKMGSVGLHRAWELQANYGRLRLMRTRVGLFGRKAFIRLSWYGA